MTIQNRRRHYHPMLHYCDGVEPGDRQSSGYFLLQAKLHRQRHDRPMFQLELVNNPTRGIPHGSSREKLMLNFLVGVFVGANFGVLVHACVLAGKRADHIEAPDETED